MNDQQNESPEAVAESTILGQHSNDLNYYHDVTLGISVEFGRTDMTIGEFLRLKKGAVIELEKLKDEGMELRINGNLVARGEVVVVNDKFGLRVTEIVSPEHFPGEEASPV